MDIQIITKELVEIIADTLILGCMESDAPLSEYAAQADLLLNGEIGDLVLSKDISGKHGEITVIYPRNKIKVQRVLLVGLGKKENLTSELVRRSAALAMVRAREMRSNTVVVEVLGLESNDTDLERCAQDTLEGALLALYQYQAPKQKKVEKQITSIGILSHDSQGVEKIQNGVERAKAIALGISLARDLVNSPPNVATPSYMAETARKIADAHEGLNIFVGDRAWADEKRMGAFLAVSKGAGEEPRFIVL